MGERGTERVHHRVLLQFEGGALTGRLIHPPGVCEPASACHECGADYSDPGSERCVECEGLSPDPDECWLDGWWDQYEVVEILEGEIEIPVTAIINHPDDGLQLEVAVPDERVRKGKSDG